MVVATKRRNDERRDSIAEFIFNYETHYGFAPSVREIAEHESTSISNAYRVLQGMIRDGEMRAVPGRARTWLLVDKTPF